MGNLFSACCGGERKGGQKLGSSESTDPATPLTGPKNRQTDAEREARLAAAEARAQASASRGVQGGGGSLAAKLESQKSIGPGRLPIVDREQPDLAAEWRAS
ncbi:uncharacterized protein SPPG_06679 [Spizellomyces punctatus DAOM BR117]|uniref:Small VCP/p97-interacting protein n=1 Tax=Spizellomyces punctatus (strain DAOM BR117) TaxID=645134 RepID=A0A0L0HAS4_SPIPD|nr:uncharacterized protein SPPG_06679 [Spizellomyces punctatus DAOM BR117]KNC98282.1 hypothetical protein SPPG_06679 [Spizellomyces punctatus DAOM BR117]|eukprot:XP_016606322.1 hypothetical protein SPPG_06679 [Spizellomyces punctatus DAOM BR117]